MPGKEARGSKRFSALTLTEKEENMGSLLTLFAVELVLAFTLGLSLILAEVMASSAGKRKPAAVSEHSENYGRTISGKVERLIGGIIGMWVVNGKEVFVTENTSIENKPDDVSAGAHVEVEGRYMGNAFVAQRIAVIGN